VIYFHGILETIAETAQAVSNMVGGNAVIALGKNAMMKSKIDKVSKDPSQLYSLGAKKRERKYFTSDPLQVVQNMFNGGRWLNTFQIPYYGNEYLSAKHSKNWKPAGSEGFFGKELAGGTPKVGEAPTLSTKRIWY
jgi:hypothetical protein